MFKQKIISLLSKEIKLKPEELNNILEIPPNPEMGDYAFPCFVLSKKYKKSPNKIAEKLAKQISKTLPKEIESVNSLGPYLNFFINKKELAKKAIKINANFGKTNIGKKKENSNRFFRTKHRKANAYRAYSFNNYWGFYNEGL